MGYVKQSAAAVAVAAATGATVLATPLSGPEPTVPAAVSFTSIDLTGSSQTLVPWPLLATQSPRSAASSTSTLAAADEPEATPGLDRIDEDFIAFRTALREDFHEFVNKTGYFGKQIYIGVNFAESIVASAVFNGTDVLRGEGLFKNLGEFAYDIFLAAVYVVADEAYLNIPGLPPAVILPDRAPVDHPAGWEEPRFPLPGRPVVLPIPQTLDTTSKLVIEDSSRKDATQALDGDADTQSAASGRGTNRDESGDSDGLPEADHGEADAGADGPPTKSRTKRTFNDDAEQTASVEDSEEAQDAKDAKDSKDSKDSKDGRDSPEQRSPESDGTESASTTA